MDVLSIRYFDVRESYGGISWLSLDNWKLGATTQDVATRLRVHVGSRYEHLLSPILNTQLAKNIKEIFDFLSLMAW